MSVTPVSRSTVVIALDQIDAPELDARIARDADRVEELSRDILRRGMIQPIHVFAKGDRFEVVDGQTRYLATQRAGLPAIECFVYPSKALALEGVKYAANIYRLDMSPADEAKMFFELYTNECGEDIERICAMTGKSFSYVSSRLNLINGDDLVFQAVKDGQIKLGVAEQLNKIDAADYRRYYLEHAILSGASVAVVVGWVTEYRRMYVDNPQPKPPDAPPAGATLAAPAYDPYRCHVCGKSDHRMTVQVNVHAACQEAILDPLLATYRGDV